MFKIFYNKEIFLCIIILLSLFLLNYALKYEYLNLFYFLLNIIFMILKKNKKKKKLNISFQKKFNFKI